MGKKGEERVWAGGERVAARLMMSSERCGCRKKGNGDGLGRLEIIYTEKVDRERVTAAEQVPP